MKVYVVQLYAEAGANFPFSHHMQKLLTEQLSGLATASPAFVKKYGADFNLGIYISARTKMAAVEVRGPTVFRKAKDVEYAVYLPYDVITVAEVGCRAALEYLMSGIREVLVRAKIDAPGLEAKTLSMIERICSDPIMFTRPWPVALRGGKG